MTKTPTPGFERVVLYTAHDGFVTGGEIPGYTEPPEVLVWGQRTFRLAGRTVEGIRYVEAFTVALVHDDVSLAAMRVEETADGSPLA